MPRDLILQPARRRWTILNPYVADLPRLQSAEAWREYADNLREETLESIIFRGVPESWRSPEPRIEWVGRDPGRTRLPDENPAPRGAAGTLILAVLYVPEKLSSKVPVVLNVNGHTPEGIAWEHYQARCINEAKRGMIALAPEWIGYGQMRRGFAHGRMNQLDLCGVSGVAVFYQAMARGIDVLCRCPTPIRSGWR
ncbi:hypothetical protein HS125_10280 [bacterium]|nr:hypothetical protein [bacterium]